MLDLAILGLLEERDLHGYELRRQLRQSLGLLANVSFGSLYPALARLEKAGAVVAIESPADSGPLEEDLQGDDELDPSGWERPVAPPTGSLSGELAVFRSSARLGRNARSARTARPSRSAHSRSLGRRSRKVYRITDEGRRMFAELLAGGGPEDARTFSLRLAFARHLAPQSRLALLHRRRAVLVERLGEAQPADDPSLDVYTRSVIEHTTEGLERDIRWIDRMIEAEQAAMAQDPAGPDLSGTRDAAVAGARGSSTEGQ